MIDQNKIENLKVKDLAQLDMESLNNDQVISRLEALADDGQYVNEPMSAREFYDALEDLFSKFGGQINGTKIFQRLNIVSKKLLWQALPALEKKIREQALGENLLFAIKNNIEILANLDAYLAIYEFGVGPDSQERQMFMASLTHNQEILGGQSIILKSGDTVTSYISNWLKDYISYTTRDTVNLKGPTYELTQYLYSSPNVKKLNPSDKQVLAQVISIYNDLRYPKYIPEIEKPTSEVRKVAPIPLAPRPIAPTPPQRPVSIPLAHGRDLEVLREQLANDKIQRVSPPLGEMSQRDREGELKPTSPGLRPPSPKGEGQAGKIPLTPAEIKREVTEIELPQHQEPKEISAPKPIQAPSSFKSASSLQSLAQISMVDDLKKIEIAHLRQGPLAQQLQTVRSKIFSIAQANRLYPYYTVNAFEQSPLFRAYLQTGSSKITENKTEGGLSQAEFEAIADFKKEIERL